MTVIQRPLHLFEAFGVELEYMIVDTETLSVKPVADEVLKTILGKYGNEVVNKSVSWSNELVSHVIEIKCTTPTPDLHQLAQDFSANLREINRILKSFHARLMPTAAHPWMQPHQETVLWPHDNRDIYNTYNRIFDCRGHGWSNLQSTHINLPFQGDEEFAKLHTAIRLILPILPALAASSPILEGSFSGLLDKRLDYYERNQRIIPSLTGRVIPEQVTSRAHYQHAIYDVIEAAIAPHDPEQLLEAVWLNSRGAIARFDRGAIEIRILDIQECSWADVSIVAAVTCLLQAIVENKFIPFEQQTTWAIDPLYNIFKTTVREAEAAIIEDEAYLSVFGIQEKSLTAQQLWKHIINQLTVWYPEKLMPFQESLQVITKEGTLARRILKALGQDFTHDHLKSVYHTLCNCVETNEMFHS